MPFPTACPTCDAHLRAPDSACGRRFRCPECGEPFVARPLTDPGGDDGRPRRQPGRDSGLGARHAVGVVLVLAVLAGVAGLIYWAATRHLDPDAWQEYGEPRGNYRIKFPEVPVTTVREHEGPKGEDFGLVVNLWDGGSEWLLAAHKPVPDPKAKGLTTDYVLDEGFSNKRLRFRGGVERAREPITYQGYPARQVLLDFPDRGTQGVGRLILAEGRLIFLIVAGKDVTPDSPRARAFFESLKIE